MSFIKCKTGIQAHSQLKASLDLARSNGRKAAQDHTIIRTQSTSPNCTQGTTAYPAYHVPKQGSQPHTYHCPKTATTPAQGCSSTALFSGRLNRKQRTQVRYQANVGASDMEKQHSCLLRKEMGKGEKSTAQP